MTSGLVLSIGEAMVELSQSETPDAWRLGIAGDTLNTAWYLRHILPQSWRVGYVSRVGTEPFSQKMLEFMAQARIETTHLTQDPTREIGLYAISWSASIE